MARTLAQKLQDLQRGIPIDAEDQDGEVGAPQAPMGPDLPGPIPQAQQPSVFQPAPKPKLSDLLQQKYDAASAPPTLKGSLIKALTQAGTIGIGGLLGGTTGAYGASQGVEQGMAQEAAQGTERRKELQTQLEAEKNREERTALNATTTQEKAREADIRDTEAKAKLADAEGNSTIVVPQGGILASKKGGAPLLTNPKEPPVHQPRAIQLKSGTIGNKRVLGRYDPDTGQVMDAAGNDISDKFEPDEGKPPKPSDSERYSELYTKVAKGQATPDEALELKGLKERLTLGAQTTFGLQNPPQKGALANVAPHLVSKAVEDSTKAGQSYVAAAQAADDMKTFIQEARKGNKIAYAYSPVEGVLTLNSGRGIKRVNINEIGAYGGAGSAADRVKAFLGKQMSGASIPDGILSDMESIHQAVGGNAKTAYQRSLKVINQNYGSQFEPVEFEGENKSQPKTMILNGKKLTLGADGKYR